MANFEIVRARVWYGEQILINSQSANYHNSYHFMLIHWYHPTKRLDLGLPHAMPMAQIVDFSDFFIFKYTMTFIFVRYAFYFLLTESYQNQYIH